MFRNRIHFLAYTFIVILSEGCLGMSLLEPPPEIICSLLCKDDLVNDLGLIVSGDLDFQKLVSSWKQIFDGASIKEQQYICWHYIDFDHCLHHCTSDPKIFLPVQLEPLEVHCIPYLTDYANAIECIGQYHHSVESNCAAYANSIKLALEKWTRNENFCNLISQHLDCLTINTEFYCGPQLVQRSFFAKRFHSVISHGIEPLTVRKLLNQCFNFSVSGNQTENFGIFPDIPATTSSSSTSWPPESTESMIPNVASTEVSSTAKLAHSVMSKDIVLPFANAIVLFDHIVNDTLDHAIHEPSAPQTEEAKHQPLLTAYSSTVSNSIFLLYIMCGMFIALVC